MTAGNRSSLRRVAAGPLLVPFSLAVVSLTLLLVLTGCRRVPKGVGSTSVSRQLPALSSLEIFPEISPDGSRVAFCSLVNGTLEIFVRQLSDPSQVTRLTEDGKQNVHPSWSPDGRFIAFHSKDRGGIWKVGSEGGTPQILADFGSNPAWSPDGKEIVFQSLPIGDILATSPPAVPPSTIWLVPASGGPARGVTKEGEPSGGHGAPFWSRDGKRIFFVASDARAVSQELWAVRPDGSDLERRHSAPRILDPALCRKTELLYYGGISASGQNAILRLPLPGKEGVAAAPEVVTAPSVVVARYPSVSHDGERLVWSSLSTNGNLWSLEIDPATLEPQGEARQLTDTRGRNTWPVYSPDGNRIAFGSTSPGKNADIWMMGSDGSGLSQLTTDPAVDQIQDWFPDGRTVLFGSVRGGSYGLWTFDTVTRQETRLPFSLRDAEVPRLSPDGTRIAYHSRKGGVTINTWVYDLRTGNDVQITFDREFLGYPVWSPDSKQLALQVRRGEDVHIVLVDPQKGEPRQLTFDRGLQWSSSFSPDGSRIVYSGLSRDSWNLYVVWVATKGVVPLTKNTRRLDMYVRYPAWSPGGRQIVYEMAETKSSVWLMEGLD